MKFLRIRKRLSVTEVLALLGLDSGMHYLWNLDNASQWTLSNDILKHFLRLLWVVLKVMQNDFDVTKIVV